MFFQNNPFEAVKQRKDLNGLEKLREAVRLNQSDTSRTQLTASKCCPSRMNPPSCWSEMIDVQPADAHPLCFWSF